jgi:hypothetical protein
MNRHFARRLPTLTALLAGLAWPWPSLSAGPPDTTALMQAQRQAIAPLAFLDGTWRGPARLFLPGGQSLAMTQTERVGPFLDGTLRLIEGRGHAPDGTVKFNALAVLSYDPEEKKYHFRSHAQGHQGDFAFELKPDGFVWRIPAGPATLRYTATVKDGVWDEVGERLVDGQAPMRIFEMRLERLGSTGWPLEGAVAPQ